MLHNIIVENIHANKTLIFAGGNFDTMGDAMDFYVPTVFGEYMRKLSVYIALIDCLSAFGGCVNLKVLQNISEYWLRQDGNGFVWFDYSDDGRIGYEDLYFAADQWLCDAMTNWDGADLDGDRKITQTDMGIWTALYTAQTQK